MRGVHNKPKLLFHLMLPEDFKLQISKSTHSVPERVHQGLGQTSPLYVLFCLFVQLKYRVLDNGSYPE